ncbi:hypothetical protein PybrP1_003657, partial [[Pythium] brassicae (nom. inval.)]
MQFIRTLALAVVATSAVVLSPVVAQFPGGKFQCAEFLNTTEPPAELLVGVVMFDKHMTVSYTDAPTKLDVLLIPGGPGNFDVVKNAGFMKYITTAAEQSKHVLSVCTGGNILATTGALDGRKATTNKVMYK